MALYDELNLPPYRGIRPMRRTGVDTTAQDPTGAPVRALQRGIQRGKILTGPDDLNEVERLKGRAPANVTPAVPAAPGENPVLAAHRVPVTTGKVDYSPEAAMTPEEKFQAAPVAGAQYALPSLSVPRSGGVTFSTPVEAGYGPGQSPILQEAANKDARAAAERAATRDTLLTGFLQRAGEADPRYQSVSQFAQANRLGNLATRVLAADPTSRLASGERIAGTEAGSRRYGADVGFRGVQEQAGATRFSAEQKLLGDVYGAEATLEAARNKALSDALVRRETGQTTLEAARIRAQGGTRVTPVGDLGGNVAIAQGGQVRFDNPEAAKAREQANQATVQAVNKGLAGKPVGTTFAYAGRTFIVKPDGTVGIVGQQ
jgi:hypothetical protein